MANNIVSHVARGSILQEGTAWNIVRMVLSRTNLQEFVSNATQPAKLASDILRANVFLAIILHWWSTVELAILHVLVAVLPILVFASQSRSVHLWMDAGYVRAVVFATNVCRITVGSLYVPIKVHCRQLS